MCGRFVLKEEVESLSQVFSAPPTQSNSVGAWGWQPDYNVTPAQTVPACALGGDGARALVPLRWGLHPAWREDPPASRPLFNARTETVASKPSFRSAWRKRRALVPANGFYEWERREGDGGEVEKLPHYIFDPARPVFAFAGIWEMWVDPDAEDAAPLLSCATLTMPADGVMANLHHRQPVRLDAEHWDAWLAADLDTDATLAAAIPSDTLEHHRVSKAVNSGRAKGAELVERL